ncbi:MAG: hypothetical protein AABW65_03310 [Nanoarchaeota archaeon]
MEKDIDRIAKSQDTDIVIRIDDFGGRIGLTIREFVKSERYTGFTKSGLRIPVDKFKQFKAAINSIDEKELEQMTASTSSTEQDSPPSSQQKLDNNSTKSDDDKEIEEQEF